MSLVLPTKDFSRLAQVAALDEALWNTAAGEVAVGRDLAAGGAPGPCVRPRSGWNVFVDYSRGSARPMRDSLFRTGLCAGRPVLSIMASMFLARRMVRPIRALQPGAARLAPDAGLQLSTLHTGDELNAVAERFDGMRNCAIPYEDLERKVQERHARVEPDERRSGQHARGAQPPRAQRCVLAPGARCAGKDRGVREHGRDPLLAAAGHDLRQPVPTLGLPGGLLWEQLRRAEIKPLVDDFKEETSGRRIIAGGTDGRIGLDAGSSSPISVGASCRAL